VQGESSAGSSYKFLQRRQGLQQGIGGGHCGPSQNSPSADYHSVGELLLSIGEQGGRDGEPL